MNHILILYKSQTGFTKRYAEWIAAETGADCMEFRAATPDQLSGYDTVVFGSRLHAGRIDGYPAMKRLFGQSKRSQAAPSLRFVLFAVGAMPGADMPGGDVAAIQQVWETNLTPEERRTIPCFYLPGGLRYERMSLPDRLMMKLAVFFMAHSQRKAKPRQATSPQANSQEAKLRQATFSQTNSQKTESQISTEDFTQMISTSYDISSKAYIQPLVEYLNTTC